MLNQLMQAMMQQRGGMGGGMGPQGPMNPMQRFNQQAQQNPAFGMMAQPGPGMTRMPGGHQFGQGGMGGMPGGMPQGQGMPQGMNLQALMEMIRRRRMMQQQGGGMPGMGMGQQRPPMPTPMQFQPPMQQPDPMQQKMQASMDPAAMAQKMRMGP